MRKLFLLLFVIGIVTSNPAFAKIYYVGIGGESSDIAGTIVQARANAGIDTVYIGVGTYKLDAELIIEDVVIGGCTSMSSGEIIRQYPGTVGNANAQQTILDGNSFIRTLPSLKHRVATVNMGGVLEGCVIRNGHARGTTNSLTDMNGFGGGVLVNGGKVHNCIIRGNVAMNLQYGSTSNPSKGGGAFITANGGEVVNCIIVFNMDDKGLGVDGNAGSVINNTISRNCNAPKYALIAGTGDTPYQHYDGNGNSLTSTLILPYIHLDDFYMAKTETTQGQYACFLAAIDLASDYSAADWKAMCAALTPMYGYHEIVISKYLGLKTTEVNIAPALLNTHASNTQYLGMSGTVGSGSEVFYPIRALSGYAAGTSGGISYPADPLVRDNFPMGFVSWYGSVAFCAWIGGMLPTEAQWEYAARKTATDVQVSAAYAGGYTDASKVGWSASTNTPHEVATLLPTKLGLYDMCGNQWEWCADWYSGTSYPANPSVAPSAATVPRGSYVSTYAGGTGGSAATAVYNPIYSYVNNSEETMRTYRGGGWSYLESYFPLGYRYPNGYGGYYKYPPSHLGGDFGFRTAACTGL